MTTYFSWGIESDTIPSQKGNRTALYYQSPGRVTTSPHSGSYCLDALCNTSPADPGNNPSGVHVSDITPDFNGCNFGSNVLNAPAVYYRCWAKFAVGFAWLGGAEKSKIFRQAIFNGSGDPVSGAPGGGLICTGYWSSDGFDLSEGYWAGSDSPIMTGGDHFARVSVPGGMDTYADGQWHEYIVRVKPNTSVDSYDGEFSLYIDGELIGSYNAFSLVSNRTTGGGPGNWVTDYNTAGNWGELWGGMAVLCYWQMGGSGGGGGCWVDDWAVSDIWNSTTYSDPDGGTITSSGTIPMFRMSGLLR
jgi:hypothetical protein